jgi:hypothetical protein
LKNKDLITTRFINLLKCLFISYAIAINTGWKNLTNNIYKIKFKKKLLKHTKNQYCNTVSAY